MSIASPRFSYEDEKQRELECREALKDRFLDKVSSKDMYAIHQEAIKAGWGLPEVQRAIDGKGVRRGLALLGPSSHLSLTPLLQLAVDGWRPIAF